MPVPVVYICTSARKRRYEASSTAGVAAKEHAGVLLDKGGCLCRFPSTTLV